MYCYSYQSATYLFSLSISYWKIGNEQSHLALNIDHVNLLTDNLVFDSSILMNTTDNEHASLVKDGNFTSCFTTQESDIWLQVDLMEKSLVTEIYITLVGMLS